MADNQSISLDKKQIGIGIILLLILSGLLYYQITLLTAAREEKRTEEKSYAQVQSLMREYIQQKENFENKQKQLAFYELLLPKSADEDELITTIKEAADMAGIEMTQIRFGNRAPKDGFTEMPITLELKGPYSNMVSMMDQMNRIPRSLRIDAIKINQEQRDTNLIRAEITANAFYSS